MAPRLWRAPAGLAFVLVLSACAGTAREDANAIARSGLNATTAMADEVSATSRRLAAGEALTAFERTWQLCQNPNPELCTPQIEGADATAARQRLVAAIETRARALRSLNQAYDALRIEAEYDARKDVEGAVRAAGEAAAGYLDALSLPVPTGLVLEVAATGAGLFAQDAQARRLAAGNAALAQITAALAAGLAEEQRLFGSLARDIVDQEVGAHRALIQAGLVGRADSVTPLITAVGARPLDQLETRLNASPATRAAAEAALMASARERTVQMQTRYGASLAALQALSRLHADFAIDGRLSTSDVAALTARLEALVKDTEEDDDAQS